MSSETTKQRVEEKYEREAQSVDAGSDHVGQMTIAFCNEDLSSCSNSDDCEIVVSG